MKLIKLLFALLLCAGPAFSQGQISGAGNYGCLGATTSFAAINSGTANNTVFASLNNTPAIAAMVQFDQTTPFTTGAATFQTSFDTGINYVAMPVAQVVNYSTGAQLTNPYTFVASTNQAFLILLDGAANFQIKLTTAITGAGAVTAYITPVCIPPGVGPLPLDASGNLQVNVKAQTLAQANVNEAQINGVTPLMGNGVSGTGSQRVNIASDNTGIEVLPTTTAATADTLSTCYLTSAATTNSTNCKGSAGNVYAILVTNTTSTIYYLRMYNLASAPTCSSATGFVETIPALATGANGFAGPPEAFATGIGFCLTGGGSSTDNTNAATGVYISILYK